MRKLLVAVPCYTHAVHTSCMLSIVRLDRLLREHGIAMDILVDNGSAYIEHSRNRLATAFVDDSDADALLFVDDDVQFDEHAVLKMLQCGAEVVGGLYPYKAYYWKAREASLQYVVKSDAPIDASADALVEVDGVGTGLLLVRRSALQKMLPTTSTYADTRTRKKMYQFFEVTIDDGDFWGEDFKFCKKWKAVGGAVHVAAWARCAHWGMHGFGLERFSVA